jgi:hypothetical protein
VFADIPVDPDSETARQWAIDELSKDRYQEHGPSWIERAWDWVLDKLDHLVNLDISGDSLVAVLIVAGIILILFLVIRAVVGPVRRSFKAKRTHSVFEDDSRSSAEMRSAADAAAKAGDWDLAILERFRAIIRSLEERDLIDDRPGVTADEAATETGVRFPDVLTRIGWAADLFDQVRYGHGAATQSDDESLRSLGRALEGRTLMSARTP